MTDINTQTGKFYENLHRTAKHKTTTAKVAKGVILAIKSLFIVEKLDISADEAHKAWLTSQKIERRQKRRDEADVRAWSAQSSTLKANLKDDE
jgi:hypothetical protein